jgi:hypothetical protein
MVTYTATTTVRKSTAALARTYLPTLENALGTPARDIELALIWEEMFVTSLSLLQQSPRIEGGPD